MSGEGESLSGNQRPAAEIQTGEPPSVRVKSPRGSRVNHTLECAQLYIPLDIMSIALSPLAYLTQKVIHSKTGHIFLLYCTVSDEDDTCTIDLTIAGPDKHPDNFETQLLGRWWTTTRNFDELIELAPIDVIASNAIEGEIQVKGWSEAKAKRRDVELDLILHPKDTTETQLSFSLSECTDAEALLRQKMLMLKITEKAKTQKCRVFPEVALDLRRELTEAQEEIANLTRHLRKRDRMIDDLKADLDTTNEQLKEYVKDAMPLSTCPTMVVQCYFLTNFFSPAAFISPPHGVLFKYHRPEPTRSQPKIPANHSKAAVTKKRRLVQKVEYED
ncbi:hypothetical protein FRB99_005072 [Tulasnella sp. 403]|nr:hypothetical protein FRB99_005072 [Tulasnella sp. 403]